jgi:hypothetical protein
MSGLARYPPDRPHLGVAGGKAHDIRRLDAFAGPHPVLALSLALVGAARVFVFLLLFSVVNAIA